MDENRVLQAMPVAMGRIEGRNGTTYWVHLPKVQRNVPKRIARITAYQKAKKRQLMLKKLMDWLYVGVCMGSTLFMAITLLNMAGMLPF